MDKSKFWSMISKNKAIKDKINVSKNANININKFCEFYTNLFSHVDRSDNDEQIRIKNSVYDFNKFISPIKYEATFDVEDICSVIKNLSKKKSPGDDGIVNEFFIYGVNVNLIFILKWFFNMSVSIGYLPDEFNVALVTPIPKKGKTDSTKDFRPISVSTSLSIIFESILLDKMSVLKNFNNNQFGYRRFTSCKHAYFTVNEVINYYNQNGSKVYVVSLDASKAFDKLWRDGLFYKLINVIDDKIWRILYKYYQLSKIKIKYDEEKSNIFTINEGVKQGGVLSPYLFNFFINELINKCIKLNVGAKIGKLNLSILAYCDDLIIVSPVASHAQLILDYCSEYASKWKMEFNAEKSASLVFSKFKTNITDVFVMNNKVIPGKEGIIYLGLPLGSQEYINDYLDDKMRKVEKSFFSLYSLGCKPKRMNPMLVSFLYKQFCQSIFRSHLDNLYISNKKLDELEIRQNIMIKSFIGVSKFSRTRPLNDSIKLESIKQIYFKHKIFFLKQIFKNDLCKEIFNELRSKKIKFLRFNNSFVKQLDDLEKKIFVNCTDYDYDILIKSIESQFRCVNKGLVDSIVYILYLINSGIEQNTSYFYLYEELNLLLKTY